jgi:uncharacterized membrane protein
MVGLLLVVTGWLGGELSYRHKIGVDSTEPERYIEVFKAQAEKTLR